MILDTSAIIAILRDETEAPVFVKAVEEAAHRAVERFGGRVRWSSRIVDVRQDADGVDEGDAAVRLGVGLDGLGEIIVEADDGETLAAASALRAPFQIVCVPPGTPRTKPRACNFALSSVRFLSELREAA